MSERKMWTPEEDKIIIRLVRQNDKKPENIKWKWSQIADLLQQQVSSSKRTGKQCRERWHNQLDPTIIKDKEWSPQQIDTLFKLQDEHGNKWASISREMPGRTDNNIKNFFYSSLRRSIRQINQYVSQYKKKSNIKPFKQTILTKILNINDQKYRDKLDIKKNSAVSLANNLKTMLARLSYEHQDKELDEEDKAFRENIVKSIQEFNKSCKKRKSKKIEEQEEPDLIQGMEEQKDVEDENEEQLQSSHRRTKPNKRTTKKEEGRRKKQLDLTESHKNHLEDKKKKNELNKIEKLDIPSEKQKMKKLKSESELLLEQHPELDKIVMSKTSSRRKVQSKESFDRQNPLKKSMSFFENVEHIPQMPFGMMTRRSSMEREFKFYDPANQNWTRKDSLAPFQIFDFGAQTNNNPLMAESYNYQDLSDKMGTGLDKASLNESGFLKMFRQPSRNE